MAGTYQTGDLVFYGSAGVYRVDGVGPLCHIRGFHPGKDYYTLCSIRRGETAYVPVDTEISMRFVLTRQEAERLLSQAGSIEACVCRSTDPRALREHYRQVLNLHSCLELLRLIKSVGAKGRQAAAEGKRLGRTDQEFKKRAEELLCEELAAALELTYADAQELLARSLRQGQVSAS